VAGRPNVGKSSLVNALLGRRRSIVSDTAGTTRDVVAEALTVERDGQAVTLLIEDRAGLGTSDDPLAALAEGAARRGLAEADAVLFVFDAGEGWTEADAALAAALPEVPTLVVANKIDLVSDRPFSRPACGAERVAGDPAKHEERVAAKTPAGRRAHFSREPEASAAASASGHFSREPEASAAAANALLISALRGTGIDALRGRLAELVGRRIDRGEAGLMLTARHRAHLAAAAEALDRAAAMAAEEPAEELIAAELAAAGDALALLLGRRYSWEVLGQIFGRFCIGK
jgi:tRNA modification GTPase